MRAKRIIPCLDIKDGRVVKGVNFVNIRDAGDPVEAAIEYEKQGADEIAFLDITATHEKRNIMINVIEKAAENVFMPITVGGGIRTIEDIRSLFAAGADKVSINSEAVKNPDFIKEAANKFGSQAVIAGGRKRTVFDAVEWAKTMEDFGAGEILLTSMDKDGMKTGYDIELTKAVSMAVTIPVIASGGVGTMEHFYEGFKYGLADAALAASVFHFQEMTIQEVKEYLKGNSIEEKVVLI